MDEKRVDLLVENTRLRTAFEILRELVAKEQKTEDKYKSIRLSDLDLVLLAAGIEIQGELEIISKKRPCCSMV